MQRCLPYGEFKEDIIKVEDVLKTDDDDGIGYVVLVDLKYTKTIKRKTKFFPFCPQKRDITVNDFEDEDYMIQHKPQHYTPTSELFRDQHNNKIYLVHYRNIKF